MREDKIGIAVIGIGSWGKNYVRIFSKHPQCRLVFVCDPNRDTWHFAKQQVPDVKTTVDFEEILSCDDVDAIVLATPASLHHKLALQSLKKNKHILIEKPIAFSYQEVCSIANASGDCVVMPSYVLGFHHGFLKFLSIVQSPDFGTIQWIETFRTQWGKVRNVENVLYSFAPHDLFMLSVLLKELPLSVSAFGSAVILPQRIDSAHAHFTWNNNICADVCVSWISLYKQRTIKVGSNTKLVCLDFLKNTIRISSYPKHNETVHESDFVNEEILLKESKPLDIQCDFFIRCILQQIPPPITIDTACHVAMMLEKTQQAMMLEKTITFHSCND